MADIDSTNRRLIDYMTTKAKFFHYERLYACQLGVVNANLGSAYTPDNEGTTYTAVNPADAPATADALRDDLVANTLPGIFTDMNNLRAAYQNLRWRSESSSPEPYGTTNKGQGIPCKPIQDGDELHAFVPLHPHTDQKYPIYLRWWVIPNTTASAVRLNTTVDRINMTRNLTGSDAVGDAATALTTTIADVEGPTTTANVPQASTWGILKKGSASDFDALFVKMVTSNVTGPRSIRVVLLEVAMRLRKFAGYR